MIVDFRALYFKAGEESFVSLERASELIGVEFEEDKFPEQGIPINDFLQFLKYCGWKIDIIKPLEIGDNIKVILTQKRIEEDDY